MQMVGDPALIQRAVGATHLTMAVPCTIAGLDVASMVIWTRAACGPLFQGSQRLSWWTQIFQYFR